MEGATPTNESSHVAHPVAKTLPSPPHPEWKPGQSQPPPYVSKEGGDERVIIDPADNNRLYFFLISAVVPRPIAFVSTQSSEGVGNVSPFSYFNVVAHNPPTLIVSVNRGRGGAKKDTQVNAEATGEMVVNIISDWYVEAANHCCGNWAYGVDETEVSGLTWEPSHKVKPHRVKEAACQMECKVVDVYDLKDDDGNVTASLLVGKIVMIHVHKAVYNSDDGTIDFAKYMPVSRLGGNTYGRVTETYDIPRPPVGPDTPGNVPKTAK